MMLGLLTALIVGADVSPRSAAAVAVYDLATLERARRPSLTGAARLQHPNIVQVFEVGEHDGDPCLALELVEGGSLARRLDGTPLPPREAAALVETLARAVHYAH